MRKREENRIILSPSVEKTARNFCEAMGRDINEFVEEAVLEKIEYEDINSDAAVAPELEEIYASDCLEGSEFKRKH